MPCPAGIEVRDAQLVVVGTAASPAKRGSALQIRPTDLNAFGPVLSTAGQVYFERQVVVGGISTTEHVDVPVTGLVWSSTLVQILSLPNLPGEADGQPKQWTIFLKDASTTGACSYPFYVEAVAPGASCPTLARVGNGVYGGAAQPALRSAPVTLTALAGLFGGPAVTSGTVTLSNALHPQGFLSPNVVWQPTAIQFTIPPDLPPTPTPAVWEVYVRATGAAAPCGPYPLVLEPGPQSPPAVRMGTIPNLPGRTDPRGQPVTLFALGGFFGGPTTSKGTVVLRRQGQTVNVPADDVVWTPVAVTFLIPDLPDSLVLAEWEALLTPDGGTALGPYRLEIAVADPLLVFVPPFIVSEERIELTAIGMEGLGDLSLPAPVYSLLAYDTAGNALFGGSKGPPPRGQRVPIGLSVTAPTVLALRQSPQCGPNQLFLEVDLKIQLSQGSHKRETNLMRTRIVMPPPQIGRYAKSGRRLTLGLPRGSSGTTGSYRGCEWVGPYNTGTVELLLPTAGPGGSADENLLSLQNALDSLALQVPEGPGAITAQLSPFPDPSLVAQLQAVKSADPNRGRHHLPVVVENGTRQWFEETIEVELPAGVDTGTIVVWRDDLPSLPLTFVEPPTVPCDATAVTRLVREVFHVSGLPGAGEVVAVGRRLPIQVTRDTAAVNALTKLMDMQASPVTVSFQLALSKGGAAPPADSALNDGDGVVVGATRPLVLGDTLNLLLRPDFERRVANQGSTAWEIEIRVTVSGLPLCQNGAPLTVSLAPRVSFRQANLPVPEIVIGIRGRWWKEEGLFVPPGGIVFFHPDTPGFGGVKIDKNSGSTQVVAARSALFAEISNLKNLLGLVSRFAALPGSPIPPLSLFDDATPGTITTPLEKALDTLSRASWSDLTFDGTRACRDLDEDRNPWWKDRIWSVLMISPPNDATLELWESPDWKGRVLNLRMPAGNVTGAYSSLWGLWEWHCRIGDMNQINGGNDNAFAGMIDSHRWREP